MHARSQGGFDWCDRTPLASQGGSTGSIHHIRYSIHTPYTIHRTPQARNRTPPASEGGFDWFDIFHTSNRRAGHGGSVPLLEINGARKIHQLPPPPSNLRNINDYPPPPSKSKSARKIAPTTPPRIYGTSTTTPPRNRPGKSLQLPPPLEFTEHQQLPPPPSKSKSARKIAPTTPPRIYGTSTTTPPRNRPGNRSNYPPSNLRNINNYPPPRNRNRPGKSHQLPPPLEFTEHQRLPPLEIGPEKSLQLPPRRIYGTSTTTPPPWKSARKIAPKSLQLPPPSNLRNINDYPPPWKSARKIAPTTPPRISNLRNFIDYPPSKSTPLFKTLATAMKCVVEKSSCAVETYILCS